MINYAHPSFWTLLKELDSRRWYEVGDKLAREKVGLALREAMKQKKQGGCGNPSKKPRAKVDPSPPKGVSEEKQSYEPDLASRRRNFLRDALDEKNSSDREWTNVTSQNISQRVVGEEEDASTKRRRLLGETSFSPGAAAVARAPPKSADTSGDSDEASKLNEVIGESALQAGVQPDGSSHSVTSSIFSSSDELV